MSKKNFKLKISLNIELKPGKLFTDAVNDYILQGNDGRDCLLNAGTFIKRIMLIMKGEVKTVRIKSLTLHEVKELTPEELKLSSPNANVGVEGVFHWHAPRKGLLEYDSATILSAFDKYMKKQSKRK